MNKYVEKKIEVTFVKAMAIVGSALLVGLVGGVFGAYNTLNSDHFIVGTLAKQVEDHIIQQSNYATKSDVKTITDRLDRIQTDIRDLRYAIDNRLVR